MAAMKMRSWLSESGAELIEFAIAFPLLLLMVAGILDFGMLMRTYEVVVNASREGARVGVLQDYACQHDPIKARTDQFLSASGLSSVDPVVTTTALTTSAGTFNACSVQLTYPYNFVPLAGVAPFFGGNFTSINLTSATVMRNESQAVTP